MCGRRIDAVIRWVTAIAGLYFADVAQLVERVLGKDEVTGSSPVIGSSSFWSPVQPVRESERIPAGEVGGRQVSR